MAGGSVNYCDKCSRMITPAEERSGIALVSPSRTLCPICRKAEESSGEDDFEIEEVDLDDDAGVAEEKPSRPSTVTRRPRSMASAPAPKNNTTLLIAGGVGGGILLAIVLIFATRGEKPAAPIPPRPTPAVAAQPVQTVTPPPVTPKPEPAPVVRQTAPQGADVEAVREKLDAIVAQIDPNLSKYSEMRAELMKLVNENLGGEVEGEIKSILSMLDGQYAGLADRALGEARDRALKIAEAGDFEAAKAMLQDVERRFQAGPWLSSKGSREISTLVASITRQQQALQQRERERQQAAAQTPPPGSADAPPAVEPGEGWTSIFNGTSLRGWSNYSSKKTTVQDGELRTEDNGDVFHAGNWGNVEIAFDFFLTGGSEQAAAGIAVRHPVAGRGGARIRFVFHSDGDVHVYSGNDRVIRSGWKQYAVNTWFKVRLVAGEESAEVYINDKMVGKGDISELAGKTGGIYVYPSAGAVIRIKNMFVKTVTR